MTQYDIGRNYVPRRNLLIEKKNHKIHAVETKQKQIRHMHNRTNIEFFREKTAIACCWASSSECSDQNRKKIQTNIFIIKLASFLLRGVIIELYETIQFSHMHNRTNIEFFREKTAIARCWASSSECSDQNRKKNTNKYFYHQTSVVSSAWCDYRTIQNRRKF